MKVIFWGTPSFSLPCLNAIISSKHQLLAVVTQPDKRRGRGKNHMPSPVKSRAKEIGVKVFTPSNIKHDKQTKYEIQNLKADLYLVVAFGQILPVEVLDQPPLGCWNTHASLLPRWRGAAPIQWALISGDKNTGVGIMAMEKGLDTGPILIQKKIDISIRDNAKDLSTRLSLLSSELMIQAMEKIETIGTGHKELRFKRLGVISQSELKYEISYARLIRKDDQIIDWQNSSIDIHRYVMGLFPNAYSYWRGKRIKILNTIPLKNIDLDQNDDDLNILIGRYSLNKDIVPGELIFFEPKYGIGIATGKGLIMIKEAQIEGKKPLYIHQMTQHFKPYIGQRFGS